MLGCFLYFKIAFKAQSSMQFINYSSFEILEMSRFCTTLERNYLKLPQFQDQF